MHMQIRCLSIYNLDSGEERTERMLLTDWKTAIYYVFTMPLSKGVRRRGEVAIEAPSWFPCGGDGQFTRMVRRRKRRR
jgi:hypothetical protein